MHNSCNKVGNILNFHLFAVVFSIIMTIFLLIAADVGSLPNLFEINYSQFGSVLYWLLIFILIFLILSSLYFIHSLSKMIFAFYNLKYFWLYEFVISLIITNIIYIYNHSFSITAIEIIQAMLIFCLTLLDIYAIGFLIIASGLRSTNFQSFFEKICQNVIIGHILGSIQLIIGDPILVIIVAASTKILEFNFDSLNEIVLSVLIVIILSLVVQELLILILPAMGIPYKPGRISDKLKDIIFNLILLPIFWLFDKLSILLKPLLSKPISSVLTFIQSINIFITITDHEITPGNKILRLTISTLLLIIYFYFAERKNILNILESLISLSILLSIISLVYFLAGPIQSIDNQTFLLCVFVILLICLLCILARSPFNMVIKSNNSDKILIRSSIVKKGWKYMGENKEELYSIGIGWSLKRKRYVLFVFDSSAGMVGIHDQNRTEKKSLSLNLAYKILESLNLKSGADKFGFLCWTENEVEKSYRDGQNEDPEILKNEMKDILAKTGENKSAGKNITNALIGAIGKIKQLNLTDKDYLCAIIFITDLFFQTDKMEEIYSFNEIKTEFEKNNCALYTIVIGGRAETVTFNSMKGLPNTTCIEIKDESAISINQDFTGLLSLFSTQFGLKVVLPEGMVPEPMKSEADIDDRFKKTENKYAASWSPKELENKRNIVIETKWNAKQTFNKKPEITLEFLFNGIIVNRSISHELHNNITSGDGSKIQIDQTMKVKKHS